MHADAFGVFHASITPFFFLQNFQLMWLFYNGHMDTHTHPHVTLFVFHRVFSSSLINFVFRIGFCSGFTVPIGFDSASASALVVIWPQNSLQGICTQSGCETRSALRNSSSVCRRARDGDGPGSDVIARRGWLGAAPGSATTTRVSSPTAAR